MHDPQQHGGRQRIDPQLAVRDVRRRRLLGRTRFDAAAAQRTPAASRVVALDEDFGGDNVLHEPSVIFQIQQAGRATRAGVSVGRILRQRHILMNVDVIGQRTQRPGMTRFAAGLFATMSPDRGLHECGNLRAGRGRWL